MIAFVDSDYKDFIYELNDGELVNDVLLIVGEPSAEVLTRGYDAGSIAKYGTRSLRIDNPIVANVAPAYATPRAQVTAILDHDIEPYATVEITIMPETDARLADILDLEISDLVTITESTTTMTDVYFIVESINISIDLEQYVVVTIGLVQARTNEHP